MSGPADAGARMFQNCGDLNQVYRHGVGKPGAVDRVRPGTVRVTTFIRDAAVYNANRGWDRDRDASLVRSGSRDGAAVNLGWGVPLSHRRLFSRRPGSRVGARA